MSASGGAGSTASAAATIEDVGQVLIAAQAELSKVRSVLDAYSLPAGDRTRTNASGGNAALAGSGGANAEVYESLKAALNKAESTLRVKAEAVMRSVEDRALTNLSGGGGGSTALVPTQPSQPGGGSGTGAAGAAVRPSAYQPRYRSYAERLKDDKTAEYMSRPEQSFGRSFIMEQYGLKTATAATDHQKDMKTGVWSATASMSPAQIVAAANGLIPNPNPNDPSIIAAGAGSGGAFVLSQTHQPVGITTTRTPNRVGLGRPIERYGRGSKSSATKISRGRTGPAPNILPRAIRLNPHAFPELSPSDTVQGVFNLVNRGRIPSHMDVGPALASEPAPLRPARATMHHYHAQFDKNAAYSQPNAAAGAFNLSTVKIDLGHTLFSGANAAASDDGRQTDEPLPSVAGSPLPPPREDEKEDMKRVALRTMQLPFPGGATAPVSAVPVPNKPTATAAPAPAPVASDELTAAAAAANAERARGYNELLDTYSLHQFIIRKGRVLSNTPEFVSFNRKYAHLWGPITVIIKKLEELLLRYSVSTAWINGQRVVELAADELELVRPPAVGDLLRCIENFHQISELMKISGQRYAGPNARLLAAIKIQATWKMFLKRRQFRRHKIQNYSAARVQDIWRRHAARTHTRLNIETLWQQRLSAWRANIQNPFRAKWNTHWVHKSRVAVHVPSLSVRAHQRASMHNFAVRQNAQLSRLADTVNPQVDVVYVAPFELHDDVQHYYLKLLEVGGVTNASQRIRIVSPENFHRFPEHFSLAKLTLYSPKTLKKIRSFIGGRPAYLVPHSTGMEDLKLAVALDIPLYAGEPDVSAIFGSKSGSRRIFQLADAGIPPGAHDIVDDDDLYSNLSQLIVDHLDVQRWIFKIDNEFGGRGIAYFDVANIKSVLDIVRGDKQHAGERWVLPDIIGAAVERVALALRRTVPTKTVIAVPSLYHKGSWATYAAALYRVGGVIEAGAPHVLCSPSVNITIEPDGTIEVTSSHDQIFTTPYQYGGALCPSTAPGPMLHTSARAIAAACAKEGVIGSIGIDFVLFYDTESESHRLWAVDLNLHYTTTAASFQLFHFLMKGKYELTSSSDAQPQRIRYVLPTLSDTKSGIDAKAAASAAGIGMDSKRPASSSSAAGSVTGNLNRPFGQTGGGSTAGSELQSVDSKSSLASSVVMPGEAEERYYSTINYLYDPNLATVQFGSFFNLCRLRGVAFDLRARKGTAFMMLDSLASGTIGILAVQRHAVTSLRTLCAGVDFLVQHIGALKVSASGGNTAVSGVNAHVYADESNLKDAAIVCRALLRAREEAAIANAAAAAVPAPTLLATGSTGAIPALTGSSGGDKVRNRTISAQKQKKKKTLSGAKPTSTTASSQSGAASTTAAAN